MRKTHLYTLLCVLCFPSLVCAQQAVFDEFRKAAGDYAALYSGKAEENYNQQKYLNHPYWNTDEFREGAVCATLLRGLGNDVFFLNRLSVMADGFTRICSSVMIPIKRV